MTLEVRSKKVNTERCFHTFKVILSMLNLLNTDLNYISLLYRNRENSLHTLYPRMSPLRSVSGTSPHRTRMLLEVVAKADTLVGPLEGTTIRGKGQSLAHFKHTCMMKCVVGMCMHIFPFSPDSLVLPWTGWLQGPEPMPLMA